MSALRDFLYLDKSKLYTFVSQIHGGMISEINETIKKQGGLSTGVNITIPSLIGGSVDVSKGKENQTQQTIQLTDPAYFSALYNYLQENSEIKKITNLETQLNNEIFEGNFSEASGIAEPPAVENWINKVRELVDFIDKNMKLFTQIQTKQQNRANQTFSKNQMSLFKGMVNFLEDYTQISRKDPGKQYIKIVNDEINGDIWCGLIPEYILSPLQATLPANVHIVGRVENILEINEVYKIVDLSQFNQPSDVNKLLTALNGLSSLIGQKPISETDLQAKHPDIFISPIAIYR